jgi:hypothetical protein
MVQVKAYSVDYENYFKNPVQKNVKRVIFHFKVLSHYLTGEAKKVKVTTGRSASKMKVNLGTIKYTEKHVFPPLDYILKQLLVVHKIKVFFKNFLIIRDLSDYSTNAVTLCS